jgi:virginiamycin B lyase
MLRIVLSLLLPFVLAVPLAMAEGQPHLDIKEWPIPWPDAQPRDPHAMSPAAVWFVAEKGNFLSALNPQTGRFSRIDLVDEPGPRSLIAGANGMLWYTSSAHGYLGRFDLKTKTIFRAPLNDAVTDLNELTFEAGERNIWFTARQSNIIGRYRIVNGLVDLQRLPTPNAFPDGIAMAPNAGAPWIALSGTNNIASIDPRTFALTVRALPRAAARPNRVAFTSDGRLWYIDPAEGYLGTLTPATQAMKEWPTPGGKSSPPRAITVDAQNHVWIAESGPQPNKLIGFDPKTEHFFGASALPASGGTVSEMRFDAASRGIWFATEGNAIGFAKID